MLIQNLQDGKNKELPLKVLKNESIWKSEVVLGKFCYYYFVGILTAAGLLTQGNDLTNNIPYI